MGRPRKIRDTRICKGCGATKPLADFSGRNCYCQPCNKERAWLLQMDTRTPNEILALIQQDLEMAERRRKYLLKKYNIKVPV